MATVLFVAVIGLAVQQAGCTREPERPVNALLITLDTTRHDALSCLGGPPGVSPVLDALAAEGVVYEAARTVAPLTLPAHSSMLTGLYPPRHTVHLNSKMALPRSAETLAEVAREHGVQTAAFVAAVVLDRDFGLDQGFDHYGQPKAPPVQNTLHYERRPADEIADEVIEWLGERDPTRPFFAWAHFYDPHVPYEPPEEFLRRAGGSPYHGAVAFVDQEISRMFDALREQGVWDETFVIVVADHGEGLEDHDETTHGTLIYDSVIRVPMILRYPDGHRAGERSAEIVSVVDVLPTILEALELGPPGDIDGISLFKRRAPADRGVYFETYYGFSSFGWSPLTGWADREGKYLHSSDPEFYASSDRKEGNDLADERDGELGRYRGAIDRLAGKTALGRTEDDAASAAVTEKMGDLGYVDGAAGASAFPHPLESTGRPSPRSRREAYRAFLFAQQLVNKGETEKGIEIFERLLADNPSNHVAAFQYGGALIQVGRNEDSIRASLSVIQSGHDWYGPRKNLGLAFDNLGDREEALKHYGKALADEPDLVEVIDRVIAILRELGREAEIPAYQMMKIEARERQARR